MKRWIVMLIVATMISFAMPTVLGIATGDMEGIQVEQAAEAHTQQSKCKTTKSWYEWDGSTWWKVVYKSTYWPGDGTVLRFYDHIYHSGVRKSGHYVYYKCPWG